MRYGLDPPARFSPPAPPPPPLLGYKVVVISAVGLGVSLWELERGEGRGYRPVLQVRAAQKRRNRTTVSFPHISLAKQC